jgi:hypothetical protein
MGYQRRACGNIPEDTESRAIRGAASVNVEDMEFSEEMCRVFKQTDPRDDLRDIMIPVYLATVDPQLYKAAKFKIDARIPSTDYIRIRQTVSQMLIRLIITEHGKMGTGHPDVQEGDLICIVYGSDVPQILRQVDGKDGHCIFIGPCNVHGLMFGESLEMGLTEQEFILV